MYFDRNISENKDGKKNKGSYLFRVKRTVNSILVPVIYTSHVLNNPDKAYKCEKEV